MKKVFQCFNLEEGCCFILNSFLLFIGVIAILCLFGEFLNKYSEGMIALASILGVIFGSSWLDTSKQKMRGKLDHDIARKYLKAVLELRDAIKITRSPFIPVEEMLISLEKKGFKPDDYEDKEKVNRSVYSLRWDKVQKGYTSLEEITTEAEISWGTDAVKVQEGLNALVRKLGSVIWLFLNYPEDFHGRKPEGERDVLYGTYDENDEFAKDLNREIEEIRIFLKNYL